MVQVRRTNINQPSRRQMPPCTGGICFLLDARFLHQGGGFLRTDDFRADYVKHNRINPKFHQRAGCLIGQAPATEGLVENPADFTEFLLLARQRSKTGVADGLTAVPDRNRKRGRFPDEITRLILRDRPAIRRLAAARHRFI